jgi:hypothetical protein
MLRLVAPELARIPTVQLYPIFNRTLRTCTTRARRDVLLDIAALAPVVRAIGGDAAALEVVHAIDDVCQRWP